MIQWFLDGGSIMWFILVFSVLSWIFIFERAFVLLREFYLAHQIKKEFDKDHHLAGNPILESEPEKSAFSRALTLIYENKTLEKEDTVTLARTQLREETQRLQRGLTLLEISSNVGPLLGLLGTVLGIVQVFSATARVGLGNPLALSGGIAVALNTTVFGLIVAIPASIALSFYERRIENLLRLIEKYAALAITGIYGKAPHA